MSKRRRSLRAALEGAVRRVPAAEDDGPSFMRGLAVGALVGAAIAGSTLWSRWRAREAHQDADVEAGSSGNETGSARDSA